MRSANIDGTPVRVDYAAKQKRKYGGRNDISNTGTNWNYTTGRGPADSKRDRSASRD